jgi:ribonucleotide monophosphatase NagD (HAD superfamily)
MKSLGLKTIFITTGKYKIEDITDDVKLDYVVGNLGELKEIL